MAKDFFKNLPTFKNSMLKMDDIVFNKKRMSIIEELYNNDYKSNDIFKKYKIYTSRYTYNDILI